MKSPNARVNNTSHKNCKRETKNLWKPVLVSKVVNPFTRALTPPFIGRRMDFYIPKIPSSRRNISSVNTYINVFYVPWFAGLISYFYKSATSSHVKPGLLRLHLWLGFIPILDSFIHEDLHISWLPKFADFWSHVFTGSWFQNFAGSWFKNFAGS
jgi:hypothetical protein